MEYFVDAIIRFKGSCNLETVDKKIKERLRKLHSTGFFNEDSYSLKVIDDKLEVELLHGFEFGDVETLVKAVLSTGLKKFGRDKLIAYQTTADCYFKNYVTKDGRFLDYCGDCIY